MKGPLFILTEAVELPIAVSSKQVRDVLRSELSTSVPVASPAIAVGSSADKVGLMHPKEGEAHLHTNTETVQPQEGPATGDYSQLCL